MSLGVKNEGRPMKRALREQRKTPWTCPCNRTHPPYMSRCPNPECRQLRPEEEQT